MNMACREYQLDLTLQNLLDVDRTLQINRSK